MGFPLSSATDSNSGLKLTKQSNWVSFGSLPAESNKNTEEGTLILFLVLRLRKLKDEVLIVIFFSYFFNSECGFFSILLFSRIKSSAFTAFIFLIFLLILEWRYTKCITRASVMFFNKCLLKARCYTVCCLAIFSSIWRGDTWTMK